MSLWEYKVITSGKGGFARPDLLEKFLNDLGREEWEIVQFHAHPDNFLAFSGLARRSTQRDWTLQDAAAAAAKAEADKLRVEFEAKFKSVASNVAVAATEERASSLIEEKVAPDDGLRSLVDTSRDDDPEAHDEKLDDWDKLTTAEEDELPSFFDAIKPHMRRNQRGPGMSVGVDYLSKKWDQTDEDVKGALVECGFVLPVDEDSKAEHVEFDGDLYWLNINRRGELWINTKEKPRPLFRSVKATRIEVEAPAPRLETPAPKFEVFVPRGETSAPRGAATTLPASDAMPPEVRPEGATNTPSATVTETPSAPPEAAANRAPRSEGSRGNLPLGAAGLNKIRPHMRRNRRGPGGSGSTTFLARALRMSEADLQTSLVAIGLTMPASAADRPVFTEFGPELWWLNLDSRGGLWINGRDKRDGETAASANAAPSTESAAPPPADGPVAPPADLATSAPTDPEALASADVPASTPTETPPDVANPASAEMTMPSTPAPAAEAPASLVAVEGLNSPAASAAEVSPSALSIAVADMPVSPTPTAPASVAPAPMTTPSSAALSMFTAVRPLLKETRTGSVAGKVARLAAELGQFPAGMVDSLVALGLKVPEKSRERPVLVEHAGEAFWLNLNAKDELCLNAKASRSVDFKEDVAAAGPGADVTAEVVGDPEQKANRRGGRAQPKKSE